MVIGLVEVLKTQVDLLTNRVRHIRCPAHLVVAFGRYRTDLVHQLRRSGSIHQLLLYGTSTTASLV